MNPVIVTDNLTKRYGQRLAVDALSLEVAPGEIFGFLGPNAAGKTTTIGMLLGLVKPSAGRAMLLGHDIAREPGAALQRVGAMIEAPAFYPYLSGRDNLRVLARASGLPDTAAAAALTLVELSERGADRVRSYSQGMKQRLGIAAALLHDPELIILDEPTNGLDPAGQHEIRALIQRLAGRGRTIFLSSHMLAEIEQLCGRVAILQEGRLLAQGTVDSLLRRGQQVQVRISGDPSHAANLLRGCAWVSNVDVQGDTLLVSASAERAAEINALLVAAGVPVTEIRARAESLEEFFLKLTHVA